jgi:hypothetical protein
MGYITQLYFWKDYTMDIFALLQMLKAMPKLGAVIALAKSMPALMDDADKLLAVIETGLDDGAKLSPGLDVSAAKAALERVRTMLRSVEATLKSVLGE